jgi:uncharacterized protein YlaN (UPF0358 family)
MPKHKDENDKLRDGTLPKDPFSGTVPVSHAKTTKENTNAPSLPKDDAPNLLKEAPLRSQLYTLADLDIDEGRELVGIDLNEVTAPYCYGWGARLHERVGGGFAQGDVVVVGAASAGAGKTAFLMQLADGFALRSARLREDKDNNAPLTPVLLVSEMSEKVLARRSLGRMTFTSARYFRAGETAKQLRAGRELQYVKDAYEKARRVFDNDFTAMCSLQRQARLSDFAGGPLVERLQRLLQLWQKELIKEHKRPVWPVVVLDSIQHYQDARKGELEALNELSKALAAAAVKEGWVLLLTSESNKEGSKGETQGSGLFRGSYKLQHDVDFALTLGVSKEWDGKRYIPLSVVKNRHEGAGEDLLYQWEGHSGFFRGLDQAEQERVEKAIKEEADKALLQKREERKAVKTDKAGEKANGHTTSEDY